MGMSKQHSIGLCLSAALFQSPQPVFDSVSIPMYQKQSLSFAFPEHFPWSFRCEVAVSGDPDNFHVEYVSQQSSVSITISQVDHGIDRFGQVCCP